MELEDNIHSALDCLGEESSSLFSDSSQVFEHDSKDESREQSQTKQNWHFSPKKEKHEISSKTVPISGDKEVSSHQDDEEGDVYEESSSMSSQEAPHNDLDTLPPILAHMSGDPIALRKWASLALSEMRALKLGKKHSNLQISSLLNENERLRQELLEANISKSQAQDISALYKTQLDITARSMQQQNRSITHNGATENKNNDSISLDILKGRLLDVATVRAAESDRACMEAIRDKETSEMKFQCEVAQLNDHITSLKQEVEGLAGQLAQRAVLYSAQERRWKQEERGLEQINQSSALEMGRTEGELKVLRQQVSKLETSLETSLNKQIHAEQVAEASVATSESALKRAKESERNLASALSEVDQLKEEVERLRVADVGEMEKAWAIQLQELKYRNDEDQKESLLKIESLTHEINNLKTSLEVSKRHALGWETEARSIHTKNQYLQESIDAFAQGGKDKVVQTLLDRLAAVNVEDVQSSTVPMKDAVLSSKIHFQDDFDSSSVHATPQPRPPIGQLTPMAPPSVLYASLDDNNISLTSLAEEQNQSLYSLPDQSTASPVQTPTPPPQTKPTQSNSASFGHNNSAVNTGETPVVNEANSRKVVELEALLSERTAHIEQIEGDMHLLTKELSRLQWSESEARRVIDAQHTKTVDLQNSLDASRERCARAEVRLEQLSQHEDAIRFSSQQQNGGANNTTASAVSGTNSSSDGKGDENVREEVKKLRQFIETTKDGDKLRQAALSILDANNKLSSFRDHDARAIVSLQNELRAVKSMMEEITSKHEKSFKMLKERYDAERESMQESYERELASLQEMNHLHQDMTSDRSELTKPIVLVTTSNVAIQSDECESPEQQEKEEELCRVRAELASFLELKQVLTDDLAQLQHKYDEAKAEVKILELQHENRNVVVYESVGTDIDGLIEHNDENKVDNVFVDTSTNTVDIKTRDFATMTYGLEGHIIRPTSDHLRVESSDRATNTDEVNIVDNIGLAQELRKSVDAESNFSDSEFEVKPSVNMEKEISPEQVGYGIRNITWLEDKKKLEHTLDEYRRKIGTLQQEIDILRNSHSISSQPAQKVHKSHSESSENTVEERGLSHTELTVNGIENETNELRKEIDRLNDECENWKEEQHIMRNKLAQAATALRNAAENDNYVQTLIGEQNIWHSEREELETKVHDLQSKLKKTRSWQSEREELETKVHDLQSQLKVTRSWQSEREELEVMIHDLQSQLKETRGWQSEREELETKVHDLQTKSRSWQSEREELETKVHDLQSKLKETRGWQSEREELEIKVHDLQSQLKETRSWQSEREALETKVHDLQNKLKETRSWQSEREELETKVHDLQSQLKETRSWHSEREALETKVHDLQNKLKETRSWQSEREELEVMIHDLQSKLTESRSWQSEREKLEAKVNEQLLRLKSSQKWEQKYKELEAKMNHMKKSGDSINLSKSFDVGTAAVQEENWELRCVKLEEKLQSLESELQESKKWEDKCAEQEAKLNYLKKLSSGEKAWIKEREELETKLTKLQLSLNKTQNWPAQRSSLEEKIQKTESSLKKSYTQRQELENKNIKLQYELQEIRRAYEKEREFTSQVEVSSLEAMKLAMNDELINQEIILSKKFRREYEEKLEIKLETMRSELERVHNVEIMERKTREEQLQKALHRAQHISQESESEYLEVLSKANLKEKETTHRLNDELLNLKKEKEEMEKNHIYEVQQLQAQFSEERATLMQQCEGILHKANLAAERLKRQQDISRSSRESGFSSYSYASSLPPHIGK